MKEKLERLTTAIGELIGPLVAALVEELVHDRLYAAAAALGVPGTRDPVTGPGNPYSHPKAYRAAFVARYDAAGTAKERAALRKEAGISRNTPAAWRAGLREAPAPETSLAGLPERGPGPAPMKYKRAWIALWDAAKGDLPARRKLLQAAGIADNTPAYWRRTVLGRKSPSEIARVKKRQAPMHYTAEQRADWVAKAKASGLSMKAFAETNDLPVTSLWTWTQAANGKAPKPHAKKTDRRSPTKMTDDEKRAFVVKALTLPPAERDLFIKRAKVSSTSYFRWLKWVKANPE